MADVRRAIMAGTLEATRVHSELNTQAQWDGSRIDVFGAIDHFRLPLMFQPLGGLLGAYLVQPEPGVLVNILRPLSVRRFTAAHELGHHRLEHAPSLDGDDLIGRSPFLPRVDYNENEIAADAFATAFLLPIWFVKGHLKKKCWNPADMHRPENVYQLSLRAGLSYLATCYAIKNHRVIDLKTCNQLTAVKPKSIKQSLIPSDSLPNWYPDIWHLDCQDNGLFVEASKGDVLVISLIEHSGAGFVWDIGGIANSDFEVIDDQRQRIDLDDMVGGHVVRQVTCRALDVGFGSVQLVESRPWEQDQEPLSSFQFSYDVSDGGRPGLFDAQLDRAIKGAA